MANRSIPQNPDWAKGCLSNRVNNLRKDFYEHVWSNFNNYEGPDGETLLTELSARQLRAHIEDVETLLANHERRTNTQVAAAE